MTALRALLLISACLGTSDAASILRGSVQKAVGHTNGVSEASLVQAVSSNPVEKSGESLKDEASGLFTMALQKYANARAMALSRVENGFQQAPPPQQQQQGGNNDYVTRVILQLLFGVFYYFIIVTKYPMLNEISAKPNEKAIELQKLDEITATCETSCPNLALSWCCTGPRAAHTLHSTGIMQYWAGLCFMSIAPCCTLWYVNSYTDLNETLGGEKRSLIMSMLCACFCSCCVVAQDAQSLDYITEYNTELCGVTDARAQ